MRRGNVNLLHRSPVLVPGLTSLPVGKRGGESSGNLALLTFYLLALQIMRTDLKPSSSYSSPAWRVESHRLAF